MGDFTEDNKKIIGNLPGVLEKYKNENLSTPFIGTRDLIYTQMQDFINSMNAYISSGGKSSDNTHAKQVLLASMQDLLNGNEAKLNMDNIYSGGDEDDEFKKFKGKLENEAYSINDDFHFDVLEFYTYYVIAVLKKNNLKKIQLLSIFREINKGLQKGGSRKRRVSSPRKRRMSSPRKSKKRSSKTTSTKGKKKGSKKSKGKKRKSQVKRRSRNNNNRNHGNH